ncbi:MAG TPA: hypothetical protein VGG16_25555 [Streptosporangiaceae bacterium]
MPSTSESTLASTRPPGRSTRAIEPTMGSAARWVDSARSPAITPSAQPSGRKSSVALSPTIVSSAAMPSPGGSSITLITRWPAIAATFALSARGPETSMSSRRPGGSQASSLPRVTASVNRQ